jgi:Cystathionine beta-lyases/cystathionine gamma-synthases
MADNTYLGPLWQKPLDLGVDLVLYSATKYLAGHSDLVAGAVMGHSEHLQKVKSHRAALGSTADPHTAWLLTRSLETLFLRMEKQAQNARVLADFLQGAEQVSKVFYLGHLAGRSAAEQLLIQKQCPGAGAMLAVDLETEARAFRFLNALEVFQLAVSLGSTESLAQHPATMTHAGVDSKTRDRYGIGPGLVRLSIGVEAVEDLQTDLARGLAAL